ncbi:ThuA domain-containing protein [Cellulomonas dongxiuzhuiae]|uniref:ThuA domain-containing protein n=1 Tax=Cellulomonas dongxiuzhuiae TaxID=2819979 RepID=A0ABX8GIX3_9CELL|nr:ThuA domain-containing protein [Cellulomonas dongxiuzhuiae]MBO3095148.1 ThuA domain-containing protein [Cellulomonas dongxiuzhuiae]QWC16152.1 ThuA domain-containing protein [Cellulomonas dongxiuzhuiae]
MPGPTSPRALVLAGRARYADPWHDHAATSHAVACELADAGFDVAVRSTFPDALADLRAADLLVVNAGQGPVDDDDAVWRPLHERVRDHAAAGGPVLALHQAAMTFADSPWWSDVMGGRWVEGRSWHPPQGVATFDVRAGHPVTRGLGPLVVDDERYTDLVVAPDVGALVTHDEGAATHPVVWVVAGRRVVYDALGHDVGSYAAPARAALLRREARWLVGLPPA